MSENVIWGIDFRAKCKSPEPIVEITEEELQTLTEMANEIVLQITDPYAGSFCPNGVDDLDYDGKEPA